MQFLCYLLNYGMSDFALLVAKAED